jgi:hypothetical protein
MARISVQTVGNNVVLEQEASTGETIATPLDRFELVALMSLMTQALNELSSDPTANIQEEQPVLCSRGPSFQVGLTGDGECLLALRPDPLPPMHFIFDAEELAYLIDRLRDAAAISPGPKQKQ